VVEMMKKKNTTLFKQNLIDLHSNLESMGCVSGRVKITFFSLHAVQNGEWTLGEF
jgi:hypothetical protein